MNIQLIHGQFIANDALDIITKMIHLKIKFYEATLLKENSNESVKFCEAKIKQLQKDLYDARQKIEKKNGKILLDGQLTLGH